MPELSTYPDKPQALLDLAESEYQDRAAAIEQAWAYYRGEMKRPLKVRTGQPDDNVIYNVCAKMISQAVALLFGQMPEFQLDVSSEETPAEETLEELWEANRGALFLNNLATSGALSGHCYVKLIPLQDAVKPVRFVALKPEQVSVFWNPADVEQVTCYMIYWQSNDIEYREDHVNEGGAWRIVNMERGRTSGRDWTVTGQVLWPWSWSQIVDWQNLPDPRSYYGDWDLQNPQLNDALNFVASNTQRIIRYHAHPRTIGTGFRASDVTDTSVDAFFTIPTAEAKVYNLEMQSDLASSMAFMQSLQAQFWAEHRGVDLTSIRDRLGQLTNFGLKVLFDDALNKLETKRRLYGMGLQAINRRALEMLGYGPDNVTTIMWEDVLPASALETVQVEQAKLDMGVESKQTAARSLGLDWDDEQERIAEERGGEADFGTLLLGAFERGETRMGREERMGANGRQPV